MQHFSAPNIGPKISAQESRDSRLCPKGAAFITTHPIILNYKKRKKSLHSVKEILPPPPQNPLT